MNEKKIAGRYLLSVTALFAVGFLLSIFILNGFEKNGLSHLDLTAFQKVMLSLGCACLPAGSYTGFVCAGLKLIQKKEPGKGVMIAVCVFFPITLALLTVFGIIMVIPSMIKSIICLLS